MRVFGGVLVTLGLAVAIHLDWHAARPTTHHLSLGLSWHWLLAVPVFALVAWYVVRAWSNQVTRASLWIVGGALVLGGIIEPAVEYYFEDATIDWAFGPLRNTALATFVATGLVAYAAVLAVARRGGDPDRA
jgi:hypothetical protein